MIAKLNWGTRRGKMQITVEENMPGATLTEDSAGDIVIHTGLHSSMGGYLHKKEGGDGDA